MENLKELNPDWQDKYSRASGCYWALKVQADPYTLPMNNVVTVTVNAPWVESYYDRTEVCDVPASLDKQARAALASAYYFQYHWWGDARGLCAHEKLDEPVGFFNYRAADGAFYTKFSESAAFCTRSTRCLGGRYAEHGPRTLCRGRKRHHPDAGR